MNHCLACLFSRELWVGFVTLMAIATTAEALAEEPKVAGSKASDEIRPFTIRVEAVVLTDLKQRLERSRIANELPGASWDYGVPAGYLRELIAYWREQYDWPAWQQRLNALPQHKTTIDGLDLHFVHVRSKHPRAMPLVLVHGWPGSFLHKRRIADQCHDLLGHGDDAIFRADLLRIPA